MRLIRWCLVCILGLPAIWTCPVEVQAATVVRVGHEQNHPMASVGQNGKSQGIMIDIVEEVARREGWTIQYLPCVWNKCLENLAAGELDQLVGIAYTPERAEK